MVVPDTEASRRRWEGCFGIPVGGVEENTQRRLARYPIGESMIQLIAGTRPDRRHARMVAAGKGGLNHICFEVEDIDEALAELKEKGIVCSRKSRLGAAGPQGLPSVVNTCVTTLGPHPGRSRVAGEGSLVMQMDRHPFA